MRRRSIDFSTPSVRQILILGGARSGKSSFAQDLAQRRGKPVSVIATAQALDDEMSARISAHRSARPEGWSTIEEPVRIDRAMGAIPTDDTVIVDCLTVWLGNMLHYGKSQIDIDGIIDDLITAMARRSGSTLVVSNEVGFGIVPATEISRAYRDFLGRVNTRLAANVDQSILMVAGRYVKLHDVGDIA